MKTYYIFRHGIATHSTKGYGEHIVDAHILPEAVQPIEKLAEHLKNMPTDSNVSSEFIRCKETAEIVTAITGKQFATDPRLNEFSSEENYSNESFETFRQRVLEFLISCEQDDTKQTFAICTHGAVIAAIKHILTEGRFAPDSLLDFPTPGVLVIIEPNGEIREKDFNGE